MRKKLLSLALALALCLGLAIPALAAEAQNNGFKQTVMSPFQNNFIFQDGIVRVDATCEEVGVVRNGAITTETKMVWSPTAIYIPQGAKISLTQSAIEDGYKIIIYTPDFYNPVVLADDMTVCQFNDLEHVKIGIYQEDENVKYGCYSVFSFVDIIIVDEPAAKTKTPFWDIGYLDASYNMTNQSGNPALVTISPELRADIEWVYEQGIAGGTSATSFSPLSSITRAQMVQMLWNYSGKPAPKSAYVPFKDVKPTDKYYNALCWAYETGVLNEVFPAEDFSPAEFCAPSQVMQALNNLFHCQLPDTIWAGHLTAMGTKYCIRANFCHYLHYADQFAVGRF